MKVYILQEITGSSYDWSSYDVLCFFDKKKAQEYLSWVENFIPVYEAEESYRRACLYELYKLGHVYHWKDVYDDEIPSFVIQEVEVYEEDQDYD